MPRKFGVKKPIINIEVNSTMLNDRIEISKKFESRPRSTRFKVGIPQYACDVDAAGLTYIKVHM